MENRTDPSSTPTPTSAPPPNRSFLRQSARRQTAAFYARLAASRPGRFMTSYRDLADNRNACGSIRISPVSSTRRRMADMLKDSSPVRLVRGFFGALYRCPLKLYGLFFLLYGITGVLLYFLIPFLLPAFPLTDRFLWVSTIIMLLSLPLISTHATFGDSLAGSCFAKWILVRFLCMPAPRPTGERRGSRGASLLAALLGVATAMGSLFLSRYTSYAPYVLPMVLSAICLCALIFTYPEAGALLTATFLPVLWLAEAFLPCLLWLVALTWISYGVKLLLLHRTARMDLLGKVFLLLCALMFLSSVRRTYTFGGIMEGAWIFLCMSEYFLIANLINTRALIARCVGGVGVSAAVVAPVTLVTRLSADEMNWLSGSAAGDTLVDLYRRGLGWLSRQWDGYGVILLICIFPLLCACFYRTKRLFDRVAIVLACALDVLLVSVSGSVSAVLCLVLMIFVFAVVMSSRGLADVWIATPFLACATAWLCFAGAFGSSVPRAFTDKLSHIRLERAHQLRDMWQITCSHPFGIGPDMAVESQGFLFEVQHRLGWIGVLVVAAILFLIWQKGLSAMPKTTFSFDCARVVAGLALTVGILVYGVTHSFLTTPAVLFTLTLLIALGSAYHDLLFSEHDARIAEAESLEHGMDCIYRRG